MIEDKNINFEMQFLGDFTDITEEGKNKEIK